MRKNQVFETVAPAISAADVDAVERAIGQTLPAAFKRHYLRFNGGVPADSQVPGDATWEPAEIAMFFSIKHPLPGQDSTSELLRHFLDMRAKKVVPRYFLPFAWDPGGHFFGLDLRDGTVAYYPTDTWDAGLSESQNYQQAARTVASSFEAFLDNLEPNPDAIW